MVETRFRPLRKVDARKFLVTELHADRGGAGAIRMCCDGTDQRHRLHRRVHDELLPRLQIDADGDGNRPEAVDFCFEIVRLECHGISPDRTTYCAAPLPSMAAKTRAGGAHRRMAVTLP
jgi:hypothetical protein